MYTDKGRYVHLGIFKKINKRVKSSGYRFVNTTVTTQALFNPACTYA